MKPRATAKVFKNGRSQAVRIPKEFRFDCDEVFVERRGKGVLLTPRHRSWNDYFKHRKTTLSPDFPDDIEDFPPQDRAELRWPE